MPISKQKAANTKKTKSATNKSQSSSTTKKKPSGSPSKKSAGKKSTDTRKYSASSQDEVQKEMRRFKKGTAKSGRGGAPVKSRKQAIAIGLSKARAKGAKVPTKNTKK